MALTVTVGEALMDTAPVPIFRRLLPTKVKEPFQFCGLLPPSVMAEPPVLSNEPPARLSVTPS